MSMSIITPGLFILGAILIWFLLFNLDDFYEMIENIKYKTKEKWEEFKKCINK